MGPPSNLLHSRLPSTCYVPGNLSIARYVKKPKPEVPVGEAVTLTAAWDIFDAEGRGFWTGMDALVDMLDGLEPAEDADA